MFEKLYKSNIQLRLKRFEKVVGEDGEMQLKFIDSVNEKIPSKEFERFRTRCKVEYVSEQPAQFNFNTLYIRKDGKVCWLFAEKIDD